MISLMEGNILAQITGIIGLIVLTIGMQSKKKRNILLSQGIANISFIIQYFLLGAVTGSVMYAINTLRAFTFYTWDKRKDKPNIILLILFILIALGLGMRTYANVFSLFPIIDSILTTYGSWQKKTKILRIGMIISSVMLIIHDLHFGAYAGMLTYIIVLMSTIIGFIRYDILKNKRVYIILLKNKIKTNNILSLKHIKY